VNRAAIAGTAGSVFQTVVVLHFAYTGALFCYFIVGEVMKATVFPPEPAFVNLGSPTIWVLRGIFAATGAIGLVLSYTAFTDASTVPRVLKRKTEVDDGTIAAALQTAHILRLAYVEAIAIYGLLLFMLDGHRYDLYGFGMVALLNLIALRPTRDKWEETYRRAAPEYPGVSTVPW
jgi:hypothetical protein